MTLYNNSLHWFIVQVYDTLNVKILDNTFQLILSDSILYFSKTIYTDFFLFFIGIYIQYTYC